MVRSARIKSEYGVYHLWQTSPEGQNLFSDEKDRLQFLHILDRLSGQFAFKRIAYCLTSNEGYHLILELEGTDLSKLMKSLNIGYAMYKKAKGPLFRDRYKSKVLENEEAIHQVISQLSCQNDQGSWQELKPLLTSLNEEKTSEPCKDCLKDYESTLNWLKYTAEEQGSSYDLLLKDKESRNAYMLIIRKKSTLSLKEIGQLFGGLSESTVCKLLKTECEK